MKTFDERVTGLALGSAAAPMIADRFHSESDKSVQQNRRRNCAKKIISERKLKVQKPFCATNYKAKKTFPVRRMTSKLTRRHLHPLKTWYQRVPPMGHACVLIGRKLPFIKSFFIEDVDVIRVGCSRSKFMDGRCASLCVCKLSDHCNQLCCYVCAFKGKNGFPGIWQRDYNS